MHKVSARLTLVAFVCLQLMAVFGLPLLSGRKAMAAELTSRSITVSTAQTSQVAAHNFKFTFGTAGNVGSVAFLYCDNGALITFPCNAPPGLDVTGANLTSQTGNTGFSVDTADTTANRLVISRPSVAAVLAASTYNFSGILNPSTPGNTQFIRITTYASSDGSGAYTDNGTVAFATQSPFDINTFVPPFLDLCVGVTVATDCSTANGNFLQLGTLRPTQPSAGTSQFAAGTNSVTGYNVFVLGTTMTSGNNVITGLSSPSPSVSGVNQFGINLRANASPAVGQNPSGPGTAAPTANYNLPNLFTFNPGDNIATINKPSDYNLMTVSYLVNINANQPPGYYNTTLTYLATADF